MDRVVGVDDEGKAEHEQDILGANQLKPFMFRVFDNLKRMDIWTGSHREDELHYPFSMESFLSFINPLDLSIEYHIDAWSDWNNSPTWLHQAVSNEMEQKFEERGGESRKFWMEPFNLCLSLR